MMQSGIFYAAAAYVCWGLFPLYFKLLREVDSSEIVAHRIAWGMLFLLVLLQFRRQWSWVKPVLSQPRLLGGFAASAALLSLNWLIYVWSVNHDRVLDASLGYFMNPLVNVLLGYLFLHERMRALQKLAIGVAGLGVAWLTWQSGHPPWIGLALALSFGCYGLLRKTASLGALEGLTLETVLLSPLALAYLGYTAYQGSNGFVQGGTGTELMLILLGPVTAIPLLLFAAGARRIPMSTLGLLQYISPSLQMLLGLLVYHEAFNPQRLLGFGLIWSALLIYSAESLWQARRVQAAPGH